MTLKKDKRAVFSPPRGMEVLIKKAAVDPAFKALLLERRAQAADSIGLRLDPTEVAMLTTIPEAQLSAIIAGTKVAPGIKKAFMGYAAAVMLAALGCSTNSGSTATTSDPGQIVPQGISPDTSFVTPKAVDNIPQATGTLSGVVTDQKGKGIAGATVDIYMKWLPPASADSEVVAPSRPVEFHVTTDEKGAFLVTALPIGIYAVEATRHNFRTHALADVRITEGQTTDVLFELLNTPEYNAKGGARPDLPDGK